MPAVSPSRPRVACLRIPRFPLAAAWPHDSPLAPGPPAARQLDLALDPAAAPRPLPPRPAWDAEPRALAEGDRLRVVSWEAARQGVRAGMRRAAALARCGDLAVRPLDTAATDRAVTRVTGALLRAAPQVTPAAGAPGTWWIGAGGLEALGGEPVLARALLDLAVPWHPDARVAIADSCVAARAATWSRTSEPRTAASRTPGSAPAGHAGGAVTLAGATLVPPGGDAAYLAPAPLGLVPMPADLREALTALGLRTLGAFAALEPADVEARWGAEGLAAWRLARGDDPRRPGLAAVDTTRAVYAELPAPVETVQPVQFLVRAALERLVADLVRDGRAAAAVAITLELDVPRHETLGTEDAARPADALDGRTRTTRSVTRELRPARPLARLEPLVEQCRGLLERWTLSAPVTGVTVHVPVTAPLAADQGDLLAPAWRDAAATVDAIITRLRATLDPEGTLGALVHPEAVDAHRLDRAGRWAPADAWTLAEAAERAGAAADAHTARAAVRLLETPADVEVTCDAAGAPRAVRWTGRTRPVTRAVHERLSGDWWHAGHYAREAWRVRVDGEGELLLFRERGTWYLEGWVD